MKILILVVILLTGCTTSSNLILGVNMYCELTEQQKANIEHTIKIGIYPNKGVIRCVD